MTAVGRALTAASNAATASGILFRAINASALSAWASAASGFTWEHDLHLWLKRAKMGDALFGSAFEQRARLARQLGLVAA
jgi:alkylation response protein AidB-like acyl-CoA dehydrogenase